MNTIINKYAVLFFTFLTLSACASGSTIVVGKTTAAIQATDVTLYLDPPDKYEKVAIVEAWSGIGITQQQDTDMAIEKLKMEAAKLGANGVLIHSTENDYGTNSGIYTAFGSEAQSGFFSSGYANQSKIKALAIRTK